MHYFSPKANRTPEFQSVDEWLQHINKGKYSELFRDARIDDMNKVAELKEKQWRKNWVSAWLGIEIKCKRISML